MPRASRRIRFVLIAAAILIAIGATIVSALMPRPPRWEAVEGRPLLGEADVTFDDPQTGLRFQPPPGWVIQARSTEGPRPRPERLLVKYKRVTAEAPAWLRVRIVDVPGEQTPGDYLRNRKPPEPGWQPGEPLEEAIKVSGAAGARLVYRGPFDPEGRGAKEYLGEVVAVRLGPRIVEFAGMFPAADAAAREQFRAALASATFQH